ncbi:RbsD/FucU family protein [Acidisphaera sp. S103]|uniref:RbsD/FucU family protein n=1 Tax=Acidisphaera sp. S103 TaxID=1747223 RepID=UPI00131A853F|nr:RbsD/FucU domain-containing protein [Acidisphaera sp. S103]
MLKSIDPVLSADLLWVLAAMGHGDDLALVDANHPAERIAGSTASGRLIRLPGLTMGRVSRAVLSVLPIDDFLPDPVRRMQVVGEPDAWPEVQKEVQAELGPSLVLSGIERFAFYDAAKSAFAVVQVGDPRPYGCFLFRKGIIAG